jgi:hypothetical protein
MKNIHWLISEENLKNYNELEKSLFASYRLRSALFLLELFKDFKVTYGENIENVDYVDYLFVGKIQNNRIDLLDKWVNLVRNVKKNNKKVIFDYTDHHLILPTLAGEFYRKTLDKNDHIITSSANLKLSLSNHFKKTDIQDTPLIIDIIEDPIDIEIQKIKKTNNREFLFYGHKMNIPYLLNLLSRWEKSYNYTLYIQSAHNGLKYIQEQSKHFIKPNNLEIKLELWSIDAMLERSKSVSGIIIPGDLKNPRKSGVSHNRLITAFALGLPVAATNYDSYLEFEYQFANIDNDEEFHTFLKKPALYSNRVKMAQKKILNYTKIEVAKKWYDLLTE